MLQALCTAVTSQSSIWPPSVACSTHAAGRQTSFSSQQNSGSGSSCNSLGNTQDRYIIFVLAEYFVIVLLCYTVSWASCAAHCMSLAEITAFDGATNLLAFHLCLLAIGSNWKNQQLLVVIGVSSEVDHHRLHSMSYSLYVISFHCPGTRKTCSGAPGQNYLRVQLADFRVGDTCNVMNPMRFFVTGRSVAGYFAHLPCYEVFLPLAAYRVLVACLLYCSQRR